MAAPQETPRAEATRARLLAAAVTAFAERGYHATTTRDIAAAAGMSPAALYVHHASKEELLYEIARRGQCGAAVRIAALGAGGFPPVPAGPARSPGSAVSAGDGDAAGLLRGERLRLRGVPRALAHLRARVIADATSSQR